MMLRIKSNNNDKEQQQQHVATGEHEEMREGMKQRFVELDYR
jgi:hypothetical protein